jgi:hypothetical protein
VGRFLLAIALLAPSTARAARPASPAMRAVLRTDFDAPLKDSTDEAH